MQHFVPPKQTAFNWQWRTWEPTRVGLSEADTEGRAQTLSRCVAAHLAFVVNRSSMISQSPLRHPALLLFPLTNTSRRTEGRHDADHRADAATSHLLEITHAHRSYYHVDTKTHRKWKKSCIQQSQTWKLQKHTQSFFFTFIQTGKTTLRKSWLEETKWCFFFTCLYLCLI